MPSRREFIQAGLAVSVVPVAIPKSESTSLTAPVGIVTPAHHRLYCVVCDVRFPPSVEFARGADRLGVRVEHTGGDITDFWLGDLSLRWREAPVAVAGLTAHGPLFCLERFGWDHGLRVVFRGTHRVLETGQVEHVISGPPAMTAAARDAGLEGPDWGCGVARLLNSCSVGQESSSVTLMTARLSDDRIDTSVEHETLLSWVIAPKQRTRSEQAAVQDGARLS
jgi:hypothetical protein